MGDNGQIPALEITGLKKHFGDVKAVDGVNLTLYQGEFYAFLGANGAGKTTTMRMIAGLLQGDEGKISVLGHDISLRPELAKQNIAFLPDEPLLYEKLSPLEYMEFVAGLWNVESKKAENQSIELLKWFDLWEVRNKRCEEFSRGMKQKTAIAAALLHEPKLLLLDEPFSGLDAAFARQLKDLLTQKCAQGACIVLTTHVMETAERLAKKIGIIHKGKILAEGDMEKLKGEYGQYGHTLEDIFIGLIGEKPDAI